MSHHHSHSFSHHYNGNLNERNLLISIFLNLLITIAQVIGGLVSGSLSLLSDALHNSSDVISLVISYIAARFSKQKASINKTFGYKRAEILAAFVNAATLVVVSVFLIIEVIERFQNPQEIESHLVIWLSLLGIIANGFSVLLLKKESENNMNMKSAYLHLFTDMLASIAVLIGGLLMKYFEMYWVDSVLTFAIAVYLIFVGYDLLKNSYKVLMLFTPENIHIKEIITELHKLDTIKNVHHVHVWQLNEDETHFEAHIDFKNNILLSEFDKILVDIEDVLLHKFNINHVNIQPEFGKCDTKEVIVQD